MEHSDPETQVALHQIEDATQVLMRRVVALEAELRAARLEIRHLREEMEWTVD